MSAFRQMTTVMNDTTCLYKALLKRFPVVENHKIAQNLYGYTGDKRAQTAELIVRRKDVGRVSNDLGFKKNDVGNFESIISDYDSTKYNQKWLDALACDYQEEKANQIMAANECDLEERTVLPNGSVQLRYVVNA